MNKEELRKVKNHFLEEYGKDNILNACLTLQIPISDINAIKLVEAKVKLEKEKPEKKEKIIDAYEFLIQIASDPKYIKIIAEEKLNEVEEKEITENTINIIKRLGKHKKVEGHTGKEKLPPTPEEIAKKNEEIKKAIEYFSQERRNDDER